MNNLLLIRYFILFILRKVKIIVPKSKCQVAIRMQCKILWILELVNNLGILVKNKKLHFFILKKRDDAKTKKKESRNFEKEANEDVIINMEETET